MNYYKQCILRRGITRQMTWIPEKFAKKGKFIKLRISQGRGCVKSFSEWDDGWECILVGNKLPEDQLHDREYLYHREVTDI